MEQEFKNILHINFDLVYVPGNLKQTVIRLEDMGYDEVTDGFWIYVMTTDEEHYSTRFCEVLGYSKEEFGLGPKQWQSRINSDDNVIAISNMEKHIKSNGEYPYYQVVRYRHRDNSEIKLICEGEIMKRDRENHPVVIFGWHQLVKAA